MTFDEVVEAMQKIRDAGYAIAIFTPEELGDLEAESVEDYMITSGNVYIATFKEDKQNETDLF